MPVKNILVAITALFVLGTTQLNGQKFYQSTSLEMIFSWADIDSNGVTGGDVLRWSPVFNIQHMFNYDINNTIGFFSGLAIRNVGFIYKVPNTNNQFRKKYRTYNLGIPLGIKLGNLEGFFIYAGYEWEFPFHYKEKTLNNGVKTNTKVGWFANQVPNVTRSILLGLQFPYGTNLKLKMYQDGFFNESYTEIGANSEPVQPFDGFKSYVIYISLQAYMFRNTSYYYKGKSKRR